MAKQNRQTLSKEPDWPELWRLIGKIIRLYPAHLRSKLFGANKDDVPWDESAKLLIKPRGNLETIEITREAVARGQIESAILLWFLDADIASIHTLSVAAQEIVHTLGKTVGKPSLLVELIKAQSKRLRNAIRFPQNFFKHFKKEKVITYKPVVGEMTLLDAVMSFSQVFTMTPLMALFLARITLERPDLLKKRGSPSKFVNGAHIDDLAKTTRSKFLQECLTRIYEH